MSLNTFITDSENLDEKISAVEFIKTLKKVESSDDKKKSQHSGESSSSGSIDKMAHTKSEDDKKKLVEKKPSASDLLVKMRSRFQHRATEPVFHTLANASETSFEQQSTRNYGLDNTIRLPQIETLSHKRRTDSAPANISASPQNKYLKSN